MVVDKKKASHIEVRKQRISEEAKIDKSDLMTTKETSEYLGISSVAVGRLCKREGISKRYGSGVQAFYYKPDFNFYFNK